MHLPRANRRATHLRMFFMAARASSITATRKRPVILLLSAKAMSAVLDYVLTTMSLWIFWLGLHPVSPVRLCVTYS